MPNETDILENDTDTEDPTPVDLPELWWLQLPTGNEYWLRDNYARQAIAELQRLISQVMHFRGRTTTPLEDGSTTSPIMLVGEDEPYTPVNGDVVTYRPEPVDPDAPVIELEFAWTGSHWNEYGSSGALKALAFKDTASSPYTPQGSVNAQAFTGTEATIGVEGTAEAQVFTGHPVDYTPAGVNTGANVTLTHDTVNSITDVGTLPVLPTFTVQDGKLIITGGSPGTLPTKGADQTVAVDVDTITQPTFTGTLAQITAEGENATSAVSASGQYTPEGDIEQAQFTGTPTTITVS